MDGRQGNGGQTMEEIKKTQDEKERKLVQHFLHCSKSSLCFDSSVGSRERGKSSAMSRRIIQCFIALMLSALSQYARCIKNITRLRRQTFFSSCECVGEQRLVTSIHQESGGAVNTLKPQHQPKKTTNKRLASLRNT